jgi:hypothetical protein
MATVSFQAPTDYSTEAADIERKRKLAEALQMQAQEPLQSMGMAGGAPIPISPYAGLAKMLNAYTGAVGQRRAKEEQQALGRRMRTEAADWAGSMPQSQTRDMNLVAGDDEGNAIPAAMKTTQPSRAEMLKFALSGLSSGNPLTAQIAGPFMAQAMKQDEPFTLGEGQQRFGPGGEVLASGGPRTFAPPAPVRPVQERPPLLNNAFPIGDDKVQPHISHDNGVTWKPVPGSKPSSKFAKQVAPAGGSGNSLGKPPPGYRWTADGNQEVIPGGPKDLTVRNKGIAESLAIKGKIVSDKVDEALGQVSGMTTGLPGAILGAIPGTSAYDLDATLDTIKANIGFNELQAMRQASPTGGALGQVAVRELDMLQAVLSSLKRGQRGEQLSKNLNAVKSHYANWKKAVDDAAALEGGVAPTPGAPPSSGSTVPVRRYNPATGRLE